MNPRAAVLAAYTKTILTLIALAVVFTLNLPVRSLALAAVFVSGAGLWTGLLVFRGTYEREVQRRPPDPKRSFRRATLTLCLVLFWIAGIVRAFVERHWAEAFATFVLWWAGVLVAAVVETGRQHWIENSARQPHDA